MTRRSVESGATFVSYEKVVVNGRTPLLAPMSRIAIDWIPPDIQAPSGDFSEFMSGTGLRP